MSDVKILGAVLFEDFELLDYYGPLEMFGTVGKELKIVTIAESEGPVSSVQGPKTLAEYNFSNAPKLDMILLPGGLGTFTESENAAMLDFLKSRAASAEAVMSVCTGSGVLAHAGILDNRKATTNKLFFSAVTEPTEKVDWQKNARWVEDGNVFTSSGVSAGMDMSLAVIAKHYGLERAQNVAMMTEYEWQSDADNDAFTQYVDQGDLAGYLDMLGRA